VDSVLKAASAFVVNAEVTLGMMTTSDEDIVRAWSTLPLPTSPVDVAAFGVDVDALAAAASRLSHRAGGGDGSQSDVGVGSHRRLASAVEHPDSRWAREVTMRHRVDTSSTDGDDSGSTSDVSVDGEGGRGDSCSDDDVYRMDDAAYSVQHIHVDVDSLMQPILEEAWAQEEQRRLQRQLDAIATDADDPLGPRYWHDLEGRIDDVLGVNV
jgi:hypothetical protein